MTRAALLSPSDAARELCISEHVVQRFIVDGIVPTTSGRIAGAITPCLDRLTVDTLAEMLEGLRKSGGVVAWGRPTTRLSGIYFVLADKLAKIGYARNIASRIAGLQTACPVDLRLIHWCAGTTADERAFHERFSDLRARGEWFRFEGALREYVEDQTRFYWGLR